MTRYQPVTIVHILLMILLVASPVLLAGNPPAGMSKDAHDFTLYGLDGKQYSLSDFKGKVIVLEWTNPNCPFVVRHYERDHIQSLQKKYTERGVIWFTINSTNPDHRDYLTSEQLNEKYDDWKPVATANLLDQDGSVGKAYGARTTPHIFVIDEHFSIVYQGAIDDDPRGRKAERISYVELAMEALDTGRSPELSATQPYGCSVKYGL